MLKPNSQENDNLNESIKCKSFGSGKRLKIIICRVINESRQVLYFIASKDVYISGAS